MIHPTSTTQLYKTCDIPFWPTRNTNASSNLHHNNEQSIAQSDPFADIWPHLTATNNDNFTLKKEELKSCEKTIREWIKSRHHPVNGRVEVSRASYTTTPTKRYAGHVPHISQNNVQPHRIAVSLISLAFTLTPTDTLSLPHLLPFPMSSTLSGLFPYLLSLFPHSAHLPCGNVDFAIWQLCAETTNEEVGTKAHIATTRLSWVIR
jgi:hypothetical protein